MWDMPMQSTLETDRNERGSLLAAGLLFWNCRIRLVMRAAEEPIGGAERL